MVRRRPGRRGPRRREQRGQPRAPSWCCEPGVGLRSVEPRGHSVLAAASVLLQWETISPALYKGSPGRWGSGIWGWGGKILSIAVLSRSVAQLGVSDNHRASGYPRIASLSHKCQPATHDLFWFHVRKWFPLWASGEGYMSTQGYSCLVPASHEFSIPDLSAEPKVLWFFSCSNHTDRWLGAMLPWKGAQASFGWKELNEGIPARDQEAWGHVSVIRPFIKQSPNDQGPWVKR